MTTIAPALLEHLRALEIALLQPATRADAARLDALLHPDFLEIGASGRRHDKAAILAALAAEASAGPVELVADGFEARALADDLVLLTWRSAREYYVFRPVLAALLLMLAAQALFWLFTFPVNAATANWTQVTPDWDDLRGQWEWSHTAGAACQFLALCSLLTALFARVRAAGR